jgi:tRNA(Leu) C34 or U34 (ribose-2'-O)-methylase TrmL
LLQVKFLIIKNIGYEKNNIYHRHDVGNVLLRMCKGTGKERHLVGSVDTLVDVRQFKQAHGGFLHAGLHRRYVAD